MLLSPNLVLTAANFLYDLRLNKYFDSFTFCPGHTPNCKKKHFEVRDSYVPQKYKNGERSPQNDYGLLVLRDKIQIEHFMPVKTNIDFEKGYQLAIFGYTTEEERNQIGKVGKNCVTEVRQNNSEILHTLNTVNGMSGGPILSVGPDGSITIIGIHKGRITTDKGTFKCGRLLTDELVQELRREADRMGADAMTLSK